MNLKKVEMQQKYLQTIILYYQFGKELDAREETKWLQEDIWKKNGSSRIFQIKYTRRSSHNNNLGCK